MPGDRECGFLLERLVVLLLRFRAQQQQQQQGGVICEAGEEAAAVAGDRPRHHETVAAAAASGSSSLREAEVQQLLSDLLSADVVFRHVPAQQRVQEFLQQLWPGSSVKDVAAAAARPYVNSHLTLCFNCGVTAKMLRSGSFHKCSYCVTCMCGKCLTSLDKEAAAAAKRSSRFYCLFCDGHPDVVELAAS
jgi:hypothetical protein